MSKIRVLFVCVHNSARSQMAMSLMNHYYGDRFEAESAGFEPGSINPLAIEAMNEIGIDISKNKTSKVFELYVQGRLYNYVITVCDESSAERCPVFAGVSERLHWSFPDPSAFTGSHEERIAKTIGVRNSIKSSIDDWARELYRESTL